MPDVAGVLDHLSHFDGLTDDGGIKVLVYPRQELAGAFVELTNDRHRRVVIILDRRAFPQEFRVHTHTEINAGAFPGRFLQSRDDHLTNRSGQHRATHRYQVPVTLVLQGITDIATHFLDKLQIKIAIWLAGRAHADHRQLTLLNRDVPVGNAVDESVLAPAPEQLLQPRLHNGRPAAVDQINFDGRHIHTDHVMPPLGQTGGTHRPDITQTKNTDSHILYSPDCHPATPTREPP